MPTGYTAGVADGTITDFKTFALQCARNFGACIMQRDESITQAPRLREVGSYYVEAVEKAKARRSLLIEMTPDVADLEAEAEYREAIEYRRKSEIECTERRNRYNTMLSETMSWAAPTPDHESLKRFMVDQLRESREFDCKVYGPVPVRRSAEEWLDCEREKAARELDRAIKNLAEERNRVAGANAWITALYESLNLTPVED